MDRGTEHRVCGETMKGLTETMRPAFILKTRRQGAGRGEGEGKRPCGTGNGEAKCIVSGKGMKVGRQGPQHVDQTCKPPGTNERFSKEAHNKDTTTTYKYN